MPKPILRVRRTAFALAMTAVLGGCAADGTGELVGPAEAGLRTISIVSRTVADGEFVEVEIRHRSRFHHVAQVALIAPNGAWHRARDVRSRQITEHGAWSGRPRGHFGISGGSSGPIFTGIGISLPIGIPIGSLFRAPTHRTRALVRVPDRAGYRADTAHWTVAVVMEQGLGPATTIKRPAPAPR